MADGAGGGGAPCEYTEVPAAPAAAFLLGGRRAASLFFKKKESHSRIYCGGGGVEAVRGGLVSTVLDWTRFALMLLGEGTGYRP